MNQPCRIVSISEENDDALSAPGDPDIYDVLDQVDDLFRRVDVRPDSNEKPFEACLGPRGEVIGATVAGLYDASPDEADPLQRPRWSFSVAVDEAHRRKGVARALVGSMIAAYPRDVVLLEGKVVNPHMIGLLRDLGFVTVDSERDGEDFSDFERRVGRRMHRPNPRRSIDVEGDPEGTRQRLIRVADAKLMEARRRGLTPLATAEDVAQAGILADLDARRRSLTAPGSRRWRAMEDEIARSASVAETPIEVLRASTAAVSQLYDVDEEMYGYGRSGRMAGERVLMAFRRAPESMAAERLDPMEPGDVLASDLLDDVLRTLSYREREVIKLRYGLGDGYTYTLEEVARIFKVTQERVRQIECKAIQRLRDDPVRFAKLSMILPR